MFKHSTWYRKSTFKPSLAGTSCVQLTALNTWIEPCFPPLTKHLRIKTHSFTLSLIQCRHSFIQLTQSFNSLIHSLNSLTHSLNSIIYVFNSLTHSLIEHMMLFSSDSCQTFALPCFWVLCFALLFRGMASWHCNWWWHCWC